MFKCKANTDNFIGYRVKIYPTEKQKEDLNRLFGIYRWAYNWAINQIQHHYKETGKFIDYFDLSKMITELRKSEDHLWLNDYPLSNIQIGITSAVKAFQRFFRKQSKFPKFKSKRKSDLKFGVRGEKAVFNKDGYVSIEGMGRKNRILYKNTSLPNDTVMPPRVYSVWISCDKDDYYISFQFEQERHFDMPEEKTPSLGIDVGIIHTAVLSDGTVYDSPNSIFLNRRLKRLKRKASKRYENMYTESKRTKTKFENLQKSNNLLKIERDIRKTYRKISNKHNTFLHTITKEIVNKNPSSIVIEDVKPSEWIHSSNNKSIKNIAGKVYEQSLYKFFHYLDYKAKERDIPIIKAEKGYPSTKKCSSCGSLNNPKTSRIYKCKCCGLIIDRDLNAAINLSKLSSL